MPSTGRRTREGLACVPFISRRLDRSRDQRPHRHAATSPTLVKQFGGVHFALASYNAGEHASALAARASRAAAGRVHRRHPVPRDAELREAHPRDGRGLSPALRPAVLATATRGELGDDRLVKARMPAPTAFKRCRFQRQKADPSRCVEGSRIARRLTQFTESVIREMTRLAQQHDAVNLSQGFPDFPAPAAAQGRRLRRRSRTM